ncbi:MAG: exodeoxyribonuclease V subunit gamma, partial [Cellvibrionales bacterium]|nr:exodeoxyribonuclease V subunit gamma [Cellvibrionales bacterium]
MIEAFHSNRLEVLALHLSQIIQHDPTDVFEREVVLVESSAMSSWLMQQITSHNGFAADIDFPFPASFIWQIYRAQFADLPQISHFDRQPLAFRLYQYFYPILRQDFDEQRPSSKNVESANTVNSEKNNKLKTDSVLPLSKEVTLFIEHLSDKCQLFEYCEYLSGLYDQYQIYRPELLKQWQTQRSTSNFQAMIWYDLHQDSTMKDRAEIFFDVYKKAELSLKPLHCKRLHLFALNNLPAAYFSLFEKISENMDVFIYVLNPSVHFWGDIRSAKSQLSTVPTPEPAEESVNPLLALMAKQGQEFIRLLEDQQQHTPVESFIDQPTESILSQLQSDVLHLRGYPVKAKLKCIQAHDNSVVIHQCHHALREVEILKNQILHFLSTHAESELEHIAVMVPDLDRYAMYFDSVFTHQGEKVPFHLAERHGKPQVISQALLSLLEASMQGFTRSCVLDCLRNPAIQMRFGIEDIHSVEQLLDTLSVHFGLGDNAWLSLGEGVVSMAFEQAMDRMLLAFTGAGDAVLNAPLGSEAILWGRFMAFIDQLASFHEDLHEKSPKAWVATMQAWLVEFVDQTDATNAQQIRIIFESMEQWLEMIKLSEFSLHLDLPTFLISLEQMLAPPPSQHFFKKGCVNIATMLPMRNLPFDMIALLGMNDGVFPPQESIDPQDEMKVSPKLGDRNRTQEARFLFLQSILSARKKWMVSYQGFNAFDNSETFPSVLVTELLHHIDRGFVMHDGTLPSKGLQIRHPLQPFDPFYFTATDRFEPLQSFDPELMAQSLSVLQQTEKPPFAQSLDSQNKQHWVLEEFIQAIVFPQKWYLACLGLFPDQLREDSEDREMMEGTGLSRYQLLTSLLNHDLLNTASYEDVDFKQVMKQQEILPQGQMAEQDWLQALRRKDDLLEKSKALGFQPPLQWQSLSLEMNDKTVVEGRLLGFVSQTPEAKRLAYIGKDVKGEHILDAFIAHVLYQKAMGKSLVSLLIGESTSYRIDPLSDESLDESLHVFLDMAGQSQSHLV